MNGKLIAGLLTAGIGLFALKKRNDRVKEDEITITRIFQEKDCVRMVTQDSHSKPHTYTLDEGESNWCAVPTYEPVAERLNLLLTTKYNEAMKKHIEASIKDGKRNKSK